MVTQLMNWSSRNKRKAEERARARSERLSAIRSGVSYAQAVCSHPCPVNVNTIPSSRAQGPSDSHSIDEAMEFGRVLSNDFKSLFGKGFIEISNDVKKFAPRFKNLPDGESKASALVALAMCIGCI